MNISRRLGIAVTALIVVALPVATCMSAASEMTAAESECCQQMAGECGSGMDMPDSHSCCTQASVQKNDAVVDQIGHSFLWAFSAVTHADLPTLTASDVYPVAIFSDIHGPPSISSKSLQALRI